MVARGRRARRASLPGREAVNGRRRVAGARLQNRRREGGLVRRVREMLGLEAEGGPPLVGPASLPLDAAVEKVPRVELHARLGRLDLHDAAARGVVGLGREPEGAGIAVDHPVEVIAPAEAELLVLLVDAGA